MKSIKITALASGMLLVGMGKLALADDTEIYLNPGAGLQAGAEPLVMFSLDYRPNLGSTACTQGECDALIAEGYMAAAGPYTFFDVLRGALKKVMDPLQGVRIGLMLNHNHNNSCEGPGQTGCSNGGYIAMGFELFMAGDANGAKQRFHDILANIPTPQGNQSHSFQGKELFFEFYRYLTGQDIYNGHNGWTDYDTNASQNLDLDGPAYDWDASIEAGQHYVSPLQAAGECTSIYTINPLFQVSNQEADSDAAIMASVQNGGLNLSVGRGGGGGGGRNGGGGGQPQPPEFEDVLRWLFDADLANGDYGSAPDIDGRQNVKSYIIAASPFNTNNTAMGYAQAGGTGAALNLSEDPDELVRTLRNVFQQILSVSTTFVAASVPVNVFNRAEVIDNVYIALFQVDADARPSWEGNLKKLKLGTIDTTPILVDANGVPAVAGDGRIDNAALTFWTSSTDLPPADPDLGQTDGRDGRYVNRGGAGQRIPGYIAGSPGLNNASGRQMFFDRGGSLVPLNADSATASELQTDLGAASPAEAEELLAYLRGIDVDDLDADGVTDEARPWIFNDSLHSRPLPINYGTRGGYSEANPAIYVAVGSNDGLMHFIRNTTTGGADLGEEVWAFAPRAGMGAARILRANGSGVAHPYTVDGSPVVYVDDANFNGSLEVGERAIMYFGMRRGGRAYYALDITNPESPSLLWTIEKSGAFAELGLTFSTPRLGNIDLGAGLEPVLIFGGGYDTNKDARLGVGTDDSEGNAIYVVNALTGDLIWKAVGNGVSSGSTFVHPELVDSIPSMTTIFDSDGDLSIDRVIVGDTGGNIWRADLFGPDPSQWKLTKLASLGRHSMTGKENDRRFFHRPDVVPAQDENGLFDAVVIGSGDRPDPLDRGGLVANQFFMIKDRNTAAGSGLDVSIEVADLGDVTDNCLQLSTNCGVDLTYGWRLVLQNIGEKVLATPLTIAGQIFFTSYTPGGLNSANPCEPGEGLGRLYAVGLQDAVSVINYDTTDDDLSNPDVPTSTADRSTILNSPGIPAEVVSVPPDMILRPDLQLQTLDLYTRWRTFWHIDEDADL